MPSLKIRGRLIAAFVVILTAGYILWSIQRVFLGAEYKGPHGEHLTPSTPRENLIAGILFVGAIIFGIFPHQVLLRYMEPTVTRQVNELTDWARRVESGSQPTVVIDGESGGPSPKAPAPAS